MAARLSGSAASESVLLWAASQPLVHVAIKLAAGKLPGSDAAQDLDWVVGVAISRAQVVAHRSAGLDGRLAERNLRLIDRICSLVGSWPEPGWTEAVERRVDQLVDARRRGHERGQEIRRSRPPDEVPRIPTVAWQLCHPNDHYFRMAQARLADPQLAANMQEWIADFAPSYAAMSAQDWSAEERTADLVVDLQMPDDVPRDWKQPLPTVVVASHHGDAASGSQLPLRLVADFDARFNGMLISVLPGERWRTCASLLDDATIVPKDGTRRLAATPPSAPTAL